MSELRDYLWAAEGIEAVIDQDLLGAINEVGQDEQTEGSLWGAEDIEAAFLAMAGFHLYPVWWSGNKRGLLQ